MEVTRGGNNPMAGAMPRHHPVMPFVAACAGIAVFSLMDALMKSASIAVGAYSAMLVRSVFGVAMMWPIWKISGAAFPARPALKLHALRGTISAGMATTFFWGLVRMPMAEAIALSFIAPLIALYLAAVLLKERVERGAVVASLMGLGGVAVIAAAQLNVRAFSADAIWGIAAILLSAVLYAFNLVLQRKQAQIASPMEVTLFQMVFSGLVLGFGAPWLLVLPGPGAAADIAMSAALAAASLLLLTWAYARAEAQALLSVEYTAFIWAAILGWLMFDEAVTCATLAGAALIVAGSWIAVHQATRPPPA